MNIQLVSLSSMTLALFIGSASAFAGEYETHDGKVVSLVAGKLVMTSQGSADGKEHTHLLTPDVKFTLDGKACTADGIKAGTKIRVTTKAGEAKVVTNIEAIDKNETFANTHDGKFVSATANSFVMTNKIGQEHAHTFAPNLKVCCDGKECLISELKKGMKIRVTTQQGDEGVAVRIQALDKSPEFASL